MSFVLAASGNVLAPALAVLRGDGFDVRRVLREPDREEWRATRDAEVFIADDPLQLLGLVYLRARRGREWKPTSDEVDALLALAAAS